MLGPLSNRNGDRHVFSSDTRTSQEGAQLANASQERCLYVSSQSERGRCTRVRVAIARLDAHSGSEGSQPSTERSDVNRIMKKLRSSRKRVHSEKRAGPRSTAI